MANKRISVNPWFALLLTLLGCIGTDLEPKVQPILRLIQPPDKIHVTGTYNFEAMFVNENGQEQEASFQWSSSNEEVFRIDQNGVGEALKAGIVDISVRFGELEQESSIIVFSSEESIRIVDAPDSLSVGQTFTLRAEYKDRSGAVTQPETGFTWMVSDELVLEIDQNGTARGLWVGLATVNVAFEGVSDSVTFEVNRAETVFDEEIRIVSFTDRLQVGMTFQFEAQYFDSSGEVDLTVVPSWSSSATSVLSIDQNGLASAVTEGTAVITALGNTRTSTISVATFDEVTSDTRSGSLEGTGYNITGNFTLTVEEDELMLNFMDASIDPNAPGPYFYLSNQNRSVTGGVNLGKAEDGTFSINVTEISSTTDINSYDFVVVWCEPFNVTLGVGSLSN